jgi:Holliday junction resolvasome RuvABC endonuclease subunit
MKKVLALDVSYTNIGWSLIEPYKNKDLIVEVGAIKNPSDPKKKKELLTSNYDIQRIAKVYTELKELYDAHKPNCIVAEIPSSGGRSQISAIGMARGTTLVACFVTEFSVPSQWTTPDDGKLAMCGTKGASKLQMQAEAISKFPELRRMVPVSKRSKSGYESWFEHSADAIAAFLAARNGSLVRYLADDNGDYDAENVLF